jgi:FG-GAP-like repeat
MSQPSSLASRCLPSGLSPLLLPLFLMPAQAQQTCLYQVPNPTTGPILAPIQALAMLDYDGDSLDDLWIAAGSGTSLRIERTGGGTFSIPLSGAARWLESSDLDSDGDLDLVAALDGNGSVGGSGIQVVRQISSGVWSAEPRASMLSADYQVNGLELFDATGDGQLDAVVCAKTHAGVPSGSGLTTFIGDGTGQFFPTESQVVPYAANGCDQGEFNGDGAVDLALLGGGLVSYYVLMVFGQGDGTFVKDSKNYPGGAYASELVVADFNGDGFDDVTVGSKYSVLTQFGDGAGSLQPGGNQNLGYYIKSLATTDADLDGDVDLVAACGSAHQLRILRNNGAANFSIAGSVPMSLQCYSIAVGETNGDGYPDAWAGDVVAGGLFGFESQCVVESYGSPKPTSQGTLPVLTALGAPSASGAGLSVVGEGLFPALPAFLGVSTQPADLPFLGGQLLLGTPISLVTLQSDSGSGSPLVPDAGLAVPVSASQFANQGVGMQLFLQLVALDPYQLDGSFALLTQGLRIEVIP